MKNYWFSLNWIDASQLEVPVRRNLDIVRILIKCVQHIVSSDRCSMSCVEKPYVRVSIAKMKRLFICTESRLYSVGMPFSMNANQAGDCELSFQKVPIDSLTLAILSSIFNDERLDCDLSRLNMVIEEVRQIFEGDYFDAGWIAMVASSLIAFDYGYIRFDADEENENGAAHPLFHLDICYSNEVQYKIGLIESANCSALVDILDVRTDCRYLVSR